MTFTDFVQSVDLIFVGRVLARDPAPGIGSGVMRVTQKVTYEVLAVLVGTPGLAQVDVHHVVVQDSKTGSALPSPAGLSETLFRRGATLLVLAESSDDPDNAGQSRFEGNDPDDGVFELSEDLIARLRAALRKKSILQSPPLSPLLALRILLMASLVLLLAGILIGLGGNAGTGIALGLAGVAAAILFLAVVLDRRL